MNKGQNKLSHNTIISVDLKNLIYKLIDLISKSNFCSYDHYNIWEIKPGIKAKQVWFHNKYAGLTMAMPLVALDIVMPKIRFFFAEKKTYPICIAQYGISLINIGLKPDEKNTVIKISALECLKRLLDISYTTKNGYGWGTNLFWMTKSGFVPPNMPCHTQTAYVFDLADAIYTSTNDSFCREILKKIADHTLNDYSEFRDQKTGAIVTGYSMIDNERPVVNSISYRMKILFRAYSLFGNPAYLDKAIHSLKFVLLMQEDTGAWPYSSTENFIDGYHTCFVLKNLIYLNKMIAQNTILENKIDKVAVNSAFEKGVQYHGNKLLDSFFKPLPFSRTNKPVFYKWDVYDLAEAIHLYALRKEFDKCSKLIKFFLKYMRNKDGGTRFRYYPIISRMVNGYSYHRYANTSMLLALSKLSKEIDRC